MDLLRGERCATEAVDVSLSLKTYSSSRRVRTSIDHSSMVDVLIFIFISRSRAQVDT